MALFEEEDQTLGDADDIEKSRLFETHQKASRSLGNYIKLVLIVGVIVAIGVVAIGYLTLPAVGDKVLAPAGLEESVRRHFIETEKRDTTEMAFFQCEQFYWVRVEVVKRPDISSMPNNMVGTFRAKASQVNDGSWSITASPVTTGQQDEPCQY